MASPLDQVADGLALVRNHVDLLAAGRDDAIIGFYQVSGGDRREPLGGDAGSTAQRVRRGLEAVLRFLHDLLVAG